MSSCSKKSCKFSKCKSISETSTIQFLNIQDFEGRTYSQPLQAAYYTVGIQRGTLSTTDANRPVGGLAIIQSYFNFERSENTNTLFLLGQECISSSNRNLYRMSNTQNYYLQTFKTLNAMGLSARGISFHDFSDNTLEKLNYYLNKYVKYNIPVTSVGIKDPLNELSNVKLYSILESDGVKIAYITIPDNRTNINGLLDDAKYPTSQLFWGKGPITIETNLINLINTAVNARNAAVLEGAQIFILNVGRGYTSSGTGSTVLSNITGFDVIYFDNQAQTIAGFLPDKNGKNVLCLAPWGQGEEYSRFSIVYNNKTQSVEKFIGKNGITLIPNPSVFPDTVIMKSVLVTTFADTVLPDPKINKILYIYDTKAHKELDKKVCTLTSNILLDNNLPVTPNNNIAIWCNLMCDALKNKNTANIAIINKINTLVPNRNLIQYFQPRSTYYSRFTAPYDFLRGDFWDTLYNEVAGSFVSNSKSVSINTLFQTLENSVNFIITTPTAPQIISGISGFIYTYKSSNTYGSRIITLTINDTNKTYTRDSNNNVPNGTDIISLSTSTQLLLSDISSAGNPNYPLISNSNDWVTLQYGSLPNQICDYLTFLGNFDPSNSIYINRFTVI